MNYRFVVVVLVSFLFTTVSFGAHYDPVIDCTSKDTSQSFLDMLSKDRGKLWKDLYLSNHFCLEVLEQNDVLTALQSYQAIPKGSAEKIPERIDALNKIQSAAGSLLKLEPKNAAEISYIFARSNEKIEHLERLAAFIEYDGVRAIAPDLPLVKIIEKKYRSEYVYLLDPGLRFSNMLDAWRQWGKHSGVKKKLSTLPLFYLWLEERSQAKLDFPLASEVYRDNSILLVRRQQDSFATDYYGAFTGLVNIEFDETEEDGSVVFLYVLSEESELYLGQGAHLATHSQLIHGARALGAGMLTIKSGKINYIDNASGHYNPTERMFLNTLEKITTTYGEDIFSSDLETKCLAREAVIRVRGVK